MNLRLPSLLCAAWLLAGPPGLAQPGSADGCGEVVTLQTHDRTTTRYALVRRPPAAPAGPVALVLLVGGGGHLDLDEQGCPRALKGNSLVRSLPEFQRAGFTTALVDAPSDHTGEDGLGGFRVAAAHAADLGTVITDVRARTGGAVWLVGTSRGAISAVNAAARLTGPAAPDGLVLTSALMVGSRGQKAWVAHSVFDLPLESIKMPVLVVGHAADTCLRSPADQMARITARTAGAREQVVTVTGGPGRPGAPSLAACEGRTPHGFLGQEAEVAAGIGRFVLGRKY
jgi:hypothetical protein